MTDTVMIAAQPRRARLRMLPYVLLFAPLVLLTMWLRYGSREVCAPLLFGIPHAYWGLLGMVGVPILLLILSLTQIPSALKVLRDGYFPPLDAVLVRPTLARRGLMIRIVHGYLMLLGPVLMLGMVLLSYSAYEEVMHGRSIDDLQRTLEADCHHP